MTITSIDDIATALAAGAAQHRNFLRNLTAPKAAGSFQSSWPAVGFPGPGVAPPANTAGSGYTCDDTTAGALITPYNNASVKNWLARVSAGATQPLTLVLADRLWQVQSTGFAATTYTVTTPGNLPARITDNGVGCELWAEQFAAAGAASGTLTATYVNPAGTTGHTGVIPAVVSAPVAGQMQPIPLQAGDTGVKQLTSFANSATWTSGVIGVTILKRIAEISIPTANVGTTFDWGQLALPPLPDDVCLMAFILATGTTAPTIMGSLDVIDK